MNLEQIDTSTTAGKAEVMQRVADGKRYCWRVKDVGRWRDESEDLGQFAKAYTAWNWAEYDYAIIAETVGPDEVWVVVGIDDGIFTKEGAEEMASRHPGTTIARYRRADLAGEVK